MIGVEVFVSGIFGGILYEYICVIFLCVIFQIIMVKKEHKSGHKYNLKHFIWVYVFFVYLMLVFMCTGAGTFHDLFFAIKENELISFATINLVPFDAASGGIFEHIENIIMFMPLGFLLPLIWKEFKSVKKVVTAGFLFSIVIELSQLLNIRDTDIDDLLMNTIGAFLGLLIFCLFKKLFKNKKEVEELDETKLSFLARHEAAFYLILSFASVFLFYNEFLFGI